MNFNELFLPVNIKEELNVDIFTNDCWMHNLNIHDRDFPNLIGKKIAIISVVNEKSDFEANLIRNHLYSYTKKEYAKIIADLGNFLFESTDVKIFEKFGYALSELISQGIIPVIISNNQDVTFSQYLAYEYLKKYVNMTCIDQRIDLYFDEHKEVYSDNYLSRILIRDPSYLFNLSLMGIQNYLCDSSALKMMDNFYFETMRLGKIRDSIDETEPILRNTDFLSIDISSVRQGDAPGTFNPSPSGFYSEEACKLARFAGLSDKLSSIGIYNYTHHFDHHEQTARLIAQMIWYFTDGVIHRFNEIQIGDDINFIKYITTNNLNSNPITFYKSRKTNRWWMEIPIKDPNFESNEIIPCSFKDYEQASQGDIPDKYWQALKRLT